MMHLKTGFYAIEERLLNRAQASNSDPIITILGKVKIELVTPQPKITGQIVTEKVKNAKTSANFSSTNV